MAFSFASPVDAIFALSYCLSYFSVMVGSIAIFSEAGATRELCVWSATDFAEVETIKMPGPPPHFVCLHFYNVVTDQWFDPFIFLEPKAEERNDIPGGISVISSGSRLVVGENEHMEAGQRRHTICPG